MYRLLIADDEKLERDALRYIVQKGFAEIGDIRDAANGRAAIARAADFLPDICFLDIQMPGVNGIEAARRIREQLPGVRIVFLTAFDYFDYAQEAIKIGVDDFIIKPAADREVIAVLTRLTRALDSERSSREESEKNREKIGNLAGMIERELSEGLSRGFIDPARLSEFATVFEYSEFLFAAARIELDLQSYPMKIDGDAQEHVLQRRCVGLLRREFSEAGGASIVAQFSGGLSALCLLSVQSGAGTADFLRLFERAAHRIRVDLSLDTKIAVSSVSDDLARVGDLIEQAGEALKSVPAGRFPKVWSWGSDGRDRRSGGGTPPSDGSSTGSTGSTGFTGSTGVDFPPENLERRLIQAIEAGDFGASDRASDDVLNWFTAHIRDAGETERRLREFSVVVRHAIFRRHPGIGLDDMDLADPFGEGVVQLKSRVRDHTARLVRAVRSQPADAVPAVITRICDFIRQHYPEEISLELLSDIASQSAFHLSRNFKHHTGMHIVEFTNRVRIERARQLLAETNLAVKEISRMVGFSDPAYFARVFRSIEQSTPSAFRDGIVFDLSRLSAKEQNIHDPSPEIRP